MRTVLRLPRGDSWALRSMTSDTNSNPAVPSAKDRCAGNFTSWYIVALLAALYAMSNVDRYVLALIADPLSQDLGISDAKLGLLLGAGFAILYAIAGLPAASWIDKRGRKPILVLGVTLWSATTILSGFAPNYTTLLAARSGVAIGEAVLTPAAISLIADLFPADRRGAPVALYAAVGSVMITGTLLVGAVIFDLAKHLAPSLGLVPWRVTLVLVGLPGLLIVALFAITVREPERSSSPAGRNADDGGYGAYLARHRGLFLSLFLATGLLSTVVMALTSWLPTIAIREFGASPSSAGYILGLSGIPTIVIGSFFWPWLARRLQANGRDGVLLSFGWSMVIAVPLAAVACVSAVPLLLFTAMLLLKTCFGALATMPPLAIQAYGEPRFRARLIATNLLCANVIGFSAGPALVPLLAHLFDGTSMPLSHALSLLGLLMTPLTANLAWRARRSVIAGRTAG